MHCATCARGQPAAAGFPPPTAPQIGSRQRTVLLPKTGGQGPRQFCERQVAWKRLYGIPDDEGDEDEGHSRAVGNTFHELIAPALLADDPTEAFRDLAADVGSQRGGHHAAPVRPPPAAGGRPRASPSTTGRSNYQIGVTLTVPGPDVDGRGTLQESKPVAVVLMARADATGREPDGTPAVVEHRPPAPDPPRWTSSSWTCTPSGRRCGPGSGGPPCTCTTRDCPTGRSVCGRCTTRPGSTRRSNGWCPLAETAAGWHPVDATAPGYKVGGLVPVVRVPAAMRELPAAVRDRGVGATAAPSPLLCRQASSSELRVLAPWAASRVTNWIRWVRGVSRGISPKGPAPPGGPARVASGHAPLRGHQHWRSLRTPP